MGGGGMLPNIELKTLLGFTVVGALVSTFGALLGVILKDYFFSRSFETWKQRQTLEHIYQRFRDPLLLATQELASRTSEILKHYPTVYLTTDVLASSPERQLENSIDDPYFRRYKLVSTLYRLCALMGWLELYRQEITYLHSGNNKHSKKLEDAIEKLRCDLADGQLNNADDWLQWRDTLIFREELRAIGEAMLELRGSTRTVMGYGRFCELLASDSAGNHKKWVSVVTNFFLDLETERKDFRQWRLKLILVHLVDLIELLSGTAAAPYLAEARKKWKRDVSNVSGT